MKLFKDGFSDRLADRVTDFMGSWTGIVTLTVTIVVWVSINLVQLGHILPFDPYPFTFLNLVLGIMAAFTGPFVMMSQGRQAAQDRLTLERDVKIAQQMFDELEAMRVEMRGKLDEIIEAKKEP